MNIDQVAVQLYTLRDRTATDMLGTLRDVAAIGYRAVELAGYGNSDPQAMRQTLDDVGLRAISAHIQLDQIEQNAERVIADLQTLGCEYVVVPFIGEEWRSPSAQVQALAERLNRAGQRLHENGIRLGYHNHQFEFAPLDGSTMWQTLIAATDPALVDFELDVYWAVVGGFDPVDLLERYGARLRLLHLKDGTPETKQDAPIGAGTLPWPRILTAARAAQAQWYIVEQDHPRDSLSDVATSFRSLQAMS